VRSRLFFYLVQSLEDRLLSRRPAGRQTAEPAFKGCQGTSQDQPQSRNKIRAVNPVALIRIQAKFLDCLETNPGLHHKNHPSK
jgi:hypothetical protein